jgi:uncharacterized protein (TIGR03000 family)
MIVKQMLVPALLALAGLFAAVETAQAQVRVVVGVGGPRYGPRYYPYGSIYVGPGYYPYSYGPRVIYAPPPVVVESPPVVVTPSPPPPPPANIAAPAHIRVLVPDLNSQVWFDGSLTKQTGTDRMFHTPDLPPGGAYSYRIRAAWRANGNEMIQERVVSVAPGQTATADFRGPASEAIPTPR